MEDQLYFYRAKVASVYDGDTIHADIDLGLTIWLHKTKLRLARINAPEIRGVEREAGLKARDFLKNLILNKDVLIETIKDRKGKYGRYLAEIWLKDGSGEYINVNDLLVEKGLAQYHEY